MMEQYYDIFGIIEELHYKAKKVRTFYVEATHLKFNINLLKFQIIKLIKHEREWERRCIFITSG